jgi:hypothetical protein
MLVRYVALLSLLMTITGEEPCPLDRPLLKNVEL